MTMTVIKKDGTKISFLQHVRDKTRSKHRTISSSIREKKHALNPFEWNENKIMIKKDGFETSINAKYGLIINDFNNIYLIFSDEINSLLDETQRQVPDKFYELILSGKSHLSENVSKNKMHRYKTDYLYRGFEEGFYNIEKIYSDINIFKIKEPYGLFRK